VGLIYADVLETRRETVLNESPLLEHVLNNGSHQILVYSDGRIEGQDVGERQRSSVQSGAKAFVERLRQRVVATDVEFYPDISERCSGRVDIALHEGSYPVAIPKESVGKEPAYSFCMWKQEVPDEIREHIYDVPRVVSRETIEERVLEVTNLRTRTIDDHGKWDWMDLRIFETGKYAYFEFKDELYAIPLARISEYNGRQFLQIGMIDHDRKWYVEFKDLGNVLDNQDAKGQSAHKVLGRDYIDVQLMYAAEKRVGFVSGKRFFEKQRRKDDKERKAYSVIRNNELIYDFDPNDIRIGDLVQIVSTSKIIDQLGYTMKRRAQDLLEHCVEGVGKKIGKNEQRSKEFRRSGMVGIPAEVPESSVVVARSRNGSYFVEKRADPLAYHSGKETVDCTGLVDYELEEEPESGGGFREAVLKKLRGEVDAKTTKKRKRPYSPTEGLFDFSHFLNLLERSGPGAIFMTSPWYDIMQQAGRPSSWRARVSGDYKLMDEEKAFPLTQADWYQIWHDTGQLLSSIDGMLPGSDVTPMTIRSREKKTHRVLSMLGLDEYKDGFKGLMDYHRRNATKDLGVVIIDIKKFLLDLVRNSGCYGNKFEGSVRIRDCNIGVYDPESNPMGINKELEEMLPGIESAFGHWFGSNYANAVIYGSSVRREMGGVEDIDVCIYVHDYERAALDVNGTGFTINGLPVQPTFVPVGLAPELAFIKPDPLTYAGEGLSLEPDYELQFPSQAQAERHIPQMGLANLMHRLSQVTGMTCTPSIKPSLYTQPGLVYQLCKGTILNLEVIYAILSREWVPREELEDQVSELAKRFGFPDEPKVWTKPLNLSRKEVNLAWTANLFLNYYLIHRMWDYMEIGNVTVSAKRFNGSGFSNKEFKMKTLRPRVWYTVDELHKHFLGL